MGFLFSARKTEKSNDNPTVGEGTGEMRFEGVNFVNNPKAIEISRLIVW